MAAGDIVSVGDGRVGDLTYEMTLSPGDTVVYSKFGIGTTDLNVQVRHVLSSWICLPWGAVGSGSLSL